MLLSVQYEEPNWKHECGCCNQLKEKEVATIEEAIDTFRAPMHEYQWGASNLQFFESGLISFKGRVVCRISFNGRVWDARGKDNNDWQSHEEVLPENFADFYIDLETEGLVNLGGK